MKFSSPLDFLLIGLVGYIGYQWMRNRNNFTPSGLLIESIREGERLVSTFTGNQTCGERNNNPGNIRPASYTWTGQVGTAECGVSGSFVVFSEPVYGIRAIAKDLLTKYARGLNTVASIITVYAPPSENLTGSYIAQVAKMLGVSENTPLTMTDGYTLNAFVRAIILHENGRISYDDATISRGVAMALGG